MGGMVDTGATSFAGLMLLDVVPKRTKPWYRETRLIQLNILLLCALFTQISVGFDASMINGMQSLPQWQRFFGQPKGTRLGAMTFGPTGGILISVTVSSQMTERFGRRLPIGIGSTIIIIGSVIQAAAQNYGMFVAARFLVGFGIGLVAVAAPPLLSEVSYPSHRGILVSFYQTSWPLGSLMAAWITYGTFTLRTSSWSWRLPSLLQCVFSIIQLILVFFAPESPRWLIYQGRSKEAFAVLTKYHADGDTSSRLVAFEMAEITATLEIEKVQKSSRWAEWFSSRGNMHRFFIAAYLPAMLQWSGNALISYYLTKVLISIGITNSKTQLVINGCLSVWNFLTASGMALLVDRAGRRFLFLLGTGGMAVVYVIWTICSALNQERHFKDEGLAAGVLVMIFVYMLFYHAAAPIATTYIMEITPFSLRSKASMMYQLTGNLAGLYNSFANPVALDAIAWKYYIVWCVVTAVNFGIIFFTIPETRGRGLEEIGEIFDGPDALTSAPNAMKKTGLDVHADEVTTFDEEGHISKAAVAAAAEHKE